MVKWNRKRFHKIILRDQILKFGQLNPSSVPSRFYIGIHSSPAAGFVSKLSFVNDLKSSFSKLIIKMKVIPQINPKLIVNQIRF